MIPRAPLLLSLAISAAAACAGGSAAPTRSTTGPQGQAHDAADSAPRGDIRRDEILMLDGKILDWRKDLGLDPRPSPALVTEMRTRPVIPPGAAGAPRNDACADVCELADYICKAQDDICRLSTELGDDGWARGKCDTAKASCSEAKKRCTECPTGGTATKAHRGSR